MFSGLENWFVNLPEGQMFLLLTLVKIGVMLGLINGAVSYLGVFFERKGSALIQDRIGPNRVGFWGLAQPIADGLKLILKEDYTPAHVKKGLFLLAPALAMIPPFLTFAVIPFTSQFYVFGVAVSGVIANLEVGILFTFGIVSLAVYGVVIAGYASNSKYSFLGGVRASAQMISYELSMGLAVIPIFMMVQGLNLNDIVINQGGYHSLIPFLPNWVMFQSPMLFLSFIIFLVAAFAETNRHPFDMPEAETELVAGYHTEYGSLKFGMFFLGEYAAMLAVSALMATLFMGGWTLPYFGLGAVAGEGEGFTAFLQFCVFFGKVIGFMALFIWIRWILPRFRYDQLMNLGWKRMLPLALANVFVTALWMWLRA
ncbi:NADH-quinone oxidoreductase subunit NuoH [Verrucomicrobia bacterium]|nr:NADH-quinone oxidoreductase subunit NuoH [Verrucomicrobiota bacterium]